MLSKFIIILILVLPFVTFSQKYSLDNNVGLSLPHILNGAYNNIIKFLYVMGENPIVSDPDSNHVKASLNKVEFLVVQDIFMTETAWHADVILPASAHAEKNGTYTNTNRQVLLGRAVVKTPENVKQDWWIIQEIAKRMGLDWNYQSPKDIFNEMKLIMPSLNNISWERLERDGFVTYPVESEFELGQDIIFNDGFPTLNKLAKIFCCFYLSKNNSFFKYLN